MRMIFMIAALAWAYGGAPLFADDFSKAAEGLAAAAAAHGMHHFAIEPFESGEPSNESAAAEARTRFSEALYALYGVGVADAEVLGELGTRGRFWAHLRIKGKIFKTSSGTTLVLSAIEAEGGGRLAVIQMDLDKNGRPPQGDMRDAPAGDWCALEFSALKTDNRRLVDARARGWAMRVRVPGFSPKEGKDPVSGWIADYRTRQKFLLLSNNYYEQDAPVTVTDEETSELEKLQAREQEFAKRCPGRQ